jgi:hypothetical protein
MYCVVFRNHGFITVAERICGHPEEHLLNCNLFQVSKKKKKRLPPVGQLDKPPDLDTGIMSCSAGFY